MKNLAAILFASVLMGCGADPQLVLVEQETSTLRERTQSRTVEIVEVSLPDYATKDDIAIATPEGPVVLLPDTLWADEPERAMTGALVRNLSAITNAQIAASPWPLSGYPEAELTVRVEQMLVSSANALTLSGQFAIGREEGRQVIKPFDVSVPLVALGAGDVARAHASAWRKLAELIAKDL